ncbi:hypothetical protein DL991_41265 [Amycolatopsis sp. WAC 01375]|uniref:hypothetical protein n=1 Tax=Amycolatopsis sp. WAC 01375 TaxID=2203194 RepID=UPI000F7851BE|nr:hypothetical protein [Amycolatopsis sp. WAC 01375]RSM68702.1 hypothetical protein DL991_41265 [Amycolatopsis sp. WAC 01375]
MAGKEQGGLIEQIYGPGCMIECISASVAEDRALTLVEASGVARVGPAEAYLAVHAGRLLAVYLLAAAILGDDADVILEWARTDADRPWAALQSRPDVVPHEWSGRRDELESGPAAETTAAQQLLVAVLRSRPVASVDLRR